MANDQLLSNISEGLEAFDILRAEEEPWLLQVFEAPLEFDLISGLRSGIIFGEPGSGKSAICGALKYLARASASGSSRLIVEWRPRPPRGYEEPSTDLVVEQLHEVLDICAFNTLIYVVTAPGKFRSAPAWAQEILVWFIRTYSAGMLELRTGSLRRQLEEAGTMLLDELLGWSVQRVLEADAAPEYIIRELVGALAEIDVDGVWVLVDDVEIWADAAPEVITIGLKSFLSTLALFEQRGFAYKIFLPTALEQHLEGVGATTRRRVGTHYLHWTADKLEQLAVRRIAWVVGCPIDSFRQICQDKTLSTWLTRCGGNTPAGWLEFLRPLVAAYLERSRRGNTKPITKKEWLEIRRRHPPKLTLNHEQRQVRVGERVSTSLTEQQYALLAYLYDRAGQVCSRSELYYLAYLKLTGEPVPR